MIGCSVLIAFSAPSSFLDTHIEIMTMARQSREVRHIVETDYDGVSSPVKGKVPAGSDKAFPVER
jgi:hypothetical protein